MDINITSFVGPTEQEYKNALAKLRIEVFRDYPYLYQGSIAYEEKYLDTFSQSEESIIVVAFDGSEVIGVSTGIPLKCEPDEVKQPWLDGAGDISNIFYFSESVLKKNYRGQGIGVKFFEAREQWAKQLNYEIATFCGVVRADNHPDKPADYIALDNFWTKRGYQKKEGFVCKMSWQEIHETTESEKELQFWYKQLR